MKPIYFPILLALALTACESSQSETPAADASAKHQLHRLNKSDLRIETQDGLHHFRVYMVTTADEMRLGLMHVSELPKDAGMLFAYGRNRQASMWMKNTLRPLDILFIKRDGTIANIHKNASPLSLDSRPSDGLVFAALEINGGLADKLGISPGDRISHTIFK
ncbi:MAG: DUF192 domain-containing protein [Pseudomonadota bacterium]